MDAKGFFKPAVNTHPYSVLEMSWYCLHPRAYAVRLPRRWSCAADIHEHTQPFSSLACAGGTPISPEYAQRCDDLLAHALCCASRP